eukprot:1625953-Alexandrium_andersonii.AAC.1
MSALARGAARRGCPCSATHARCGPRDAEAQRAPPTDCRVCNWATCESGAGAGWQRGPTRS